MVRIFHNPGCRKSRETLNLLEEKGEVTAVVEYLKTPPSKEELRKIVNMLGKKPEALIRKGETEYKENFKGKDLSDDEWLDAMVKFPILIERPIVIKEDKAALGRPPENVLGIL